MHRTRNEAVNGRPQQAKQSFTSVPRQPTLIYKAQPQVDQSCGLPKPEGSYNFVGGGTAPSIRRMPAAGRGTAMLKTLIFPFWCTFRKVLHVCLHTINTVQAADLPTASGDHNTPKSRTNRAAGKLPQILPLRRLYSERL